MNPSKINLIYNVLKFHQNLNYNNLNLDRGRNYKDYKVFILSLFHQFYLHLIVNYLFKVLNNRLYFKISNVQFMFL